MPVKVVKAMQNLHRTQYEIEVWLLSAPQQTAVERRQKGSGFMRVAGSHTLADASEAIGSERRRAADG